MLATPDISHFSRQDYNQIYEPDADSFLLLDALELNVIDLIQQRSLIVLELGPGSGIVTSFVGKHLCPSSTLFFAVDLNEYACHSTRRTFKQNHLDQYPHYLEIIRGDLAGPFLDRLHSQVDLLLFNPPYVPTETTDVVDVIDAAFAGGKQGIEVIQRAIKQAAVLLSIQGVFYMVALEENGYETLKEIANEVGLSVEIVMKRRTQIERLFVVKFRRK